VSQFDERALRQRLHEELGSLEISPVPVIAVTDRGRAVRARRRALVAGVAAAAAVALVAANFAAAHAPARGGVTLNAPNRSAPNGVFASGTANGKPWQLAVRNVDADPGTPWCMPAVMLNGHDGDVLFKAMKAPPSYEPPFYGNPAFLTKIPGFPGVSAVFTQVAPRATKLTATFFNGTWLAVRPVWVSACSQQFHLAGFVYADSRRAVTQLIAQSSSTSAEQYFSSSSRAPAGSQAGLWTNFDGSLTDRGAGTSGDIGQGTTDGVPWTIKEQLGLGGQCYTVMARASNFTGWEHQCVPVAAPPSVAALDPAPFPDGIGGLSGYAGLVSPRTAKVTVTLSAAPELTIKPVNVAGRVYVAFAVPPGCQATRMRLFDSAGRLFASTMGVSSPKRARFGPF
jgi:hypothetical protein